MVTVRLAWDQAADQTLPLPAYATAGAAGADVCANLLDRQTMTIAPGGRALVPTGLLMAIPSGFEVQIRPRSGLALKHGVTLLNTPGTIDSDYRGPVGVILVNHGADVFAVVHGMRIAQMVVAPVIQAVFEIGELDQTVRGGGGFGSTGLTS